MASDVQILISAQDKATDTLKTVVGRLDEITNKLNSVTGASQQMSESMERASSSLFSFNTSMGKFLVNSLYFSAMGAAIQGITDAISSAAEAMVGFNAKQEQTALGFETLIGNADAAKTLMADLQNLADFSPFQYKELTTSARNLLAFGDAARDVIPDLTAIGNVVSGLGLGEDGLNHIVMALGKLGLETKASAKEIRQLNAWGVNAQKYLQQELGLTAEQISKIKDAGVTGQEAMRAIISGMSKDPMFAGMMEKQSRTILGLLATLKDQSLTIFSTIGSVMTQPINDALSNLVDKSTQLTRTLRNYGGSGLFEEKPKMDNQGNPTGEMVPPLLPEKWQNALGVAYNAVEAFWSKCEEAFTAIGKLIDDTFGDSSANLFGTFVEVLARVGMAALSIVTGIVNAADAVVNLVSEFTILQAIVVGVVAGFLAYEATLSIITTVTAIYTAVTTAAALVTDTFAAATFIMTAAIADYGIVQGVVNGIVMLFDASLIPVAGTALLVAAAVGVLAAAGYLIYDNWDALAPYAQVVWDGICGIVDFAVNLIMSLFDGLGSFVPGVMVTFSAVLFSIFNGISSGSVQIFTDMVNTIAEAFSWLLGKVQSIMGPIGNAIKGLADAVGSSIGGAWDALTGTISGGMDGIKGFVSKMQGLAQVTPAGREAIQNHEPWRMDEDASGGGGKGRKGRDGTKAYENASEKILQLQEDLQAKIENLEGTTYDANIHKLNKEIDKINAQMRKAAEAGVDEDELNKVAELRDKYAKAQIDKLNRDLDQAQRKFSAESLALEAKNVGDKGQLAEAERQKALIELEKQTEDWKKAGISEAEIARRTADQKLAIEKAYTTAVEAAEVEKLGWQIQHNTNLVTLEGKTKQEVEDLNQDLYKKQAAIYKKIIEDAKSTAAERADAEKNLAAVTDQMAQHARHSYSTAWGEAYKEIQNKQTDFAAIIVQAFDDISKSVSGAFEDWLTGAKSFSDAFKSLILDLSKSIVKMFVDMWVQSQVMGPMKSWFSSLLGIGKAGTGGELLGDYGGSDIFEGIGTAATGGMRQGWTLVGEEGPELVNFTNPARVYTNRDSQGFFQGSSGASIVMNIQTNDANSFRRSKGQLLAEMSAGLATARRYS